MSSLTPVPTVRLGTRNSVVMFVMKSLPISSFKGSLVTFVVITVIFVIVAYYYVFGFSRPYSPPVKSQYDSKYLPCGSVT